jgi:hypothetical protein
VEVAATLQAAGMDGMAYLAEPDRFRREVALKVGERALELRRRWEASAVVLAYEGE